MYSGRASPADGDIALMENKQRVLENAPSVEVIAADATPAVPNAESNLQVLENGPSVDGVALASQESGIDATNAASHTKDRPQGFQNGPGVDGVVLASQGPGSIATTTAAVAAAVAVPVRDTSWDVDDGHGVLEEERDIADKPVVSPQQLQSRQLMRISSGCLS